MPVLGTSFPPASARHDVASRGLPVARGAPPGGSVSVVLVVHNRLDLTHACLESLRQTARPLRALRRGQRLQRRDPVVLPAMVRRAGAPLPAEPRERRADPRPQPGRGAGPRRPDLLPAQRYRDAGSRSWLGKLAAAVGTGREVGLAGLYGARYVRGAAPIMGRSIVHCLAEGPMMRGRSSRWRSWTACASSSRGRCSRRSAASTRATASSTATTATSRSLFRATGRRCVVVRSRFVHRGGGTRTGPQAPVNAETDLAHRREAMAHFVRKWGHALPADVRGVRERLADRLRPLLTRVPLVGSWARRRL